MKEVIYTGIFVVLGILLILLLIFMFLPGKGGKGNKEAAAPTSKYVAGVYSSSIKLNDNAIDVCLLYTSRTAPNRLTGNAGNSQIRTAIARITSRIPFIGKSLSVRSILASPFPYPFSA